ncbi:uncharacterized protein KY384_000260 [Bacidia gigantensis]|uniref:uncharacterized protein n=1 Tax=Bacidia gigantensis TaxID=2732470 RepID=UPI001D05A4A4|nr:uncharacterized protein KY384_000260 [Bacidia gigantensis]KAG8526267.1 hypothetical protein KY384_000260 [Bacidia gigantensis]
MADSLTVQYMLSRIQERLREQDQGYDTITQNDIHEMTAEDSAEPVAKAMATIQTLSEGTQQAVGTLMQEVAPEIVSNEAAILPELLNEEEQSGVPPISPKPDLRAEVLQLEEQYAKIASQLERLNKDYKDLERDHHSVCGTLERSQKTNDALASQVVERDDQLKRLSSVNSQREQSSVRELENKISQQEELISRHESDLTKAHTQLQESQREKKKLFEESDRLQKLQDDYDATKLELEKQSRKANTVDKYVQKLQTSQAAERERDALRQELEEVRTEIASAASLQRENLKLQKTNDEVSRTLAQIEREHGELHVSTKQLRLKCGRLSQQVDDLNERFAQDQETIAEFRETKGDVPNPASPTNNNQLDGELLMSSERDTDLKSRLSTLEKDLADRDATITNLRQERDEAKATSDEHSKELRKLQQDTIVIENSFNQVHHGHPVEGTEIFRRMRDQCNTAEAQRSQLDNNNNTLRVEIQRLRNEREAPPHNPRSFNGTSESQTFEELKRQDLESLTLSPSKNEARKQDREVWKGETDEGPHHEVLNKANLTKDLTDGEPTNILKESRDSSVEQSKVDEMDNRDASDTFGYNEAHSSRPRDINSLEPQTRSYIQNLELETRLMASAYHDISSRLQMHNVTLQRRAEPPKNWLGRQRRALEGPIGLAR